LNRAKQETFEAASLLPKQFFFPPFFFGQLREVEVAAEEMANIYTVIN